MANNTISLKGQGIRKELVAGGAITPGHLIKAGATAVVHPTAGGNAAKTFAVENDLVGYGIDVAYGSGDTVQYETFPQGAEVYALLEYAENVTKGDALESAGDGTLQAHVPTDSSASGVDIQVDAIVAYAAESINNNSGGVAVRIKVEVA